MDYKYILYIIFTIIIFNILHYILHLNIYAFILYSLVFRHIVLYPIIEILHKQIFFWDTAEL